MSIFEEVKAYAGVTADLALNKAKLAELERVEAELTKSISFLEEKIRLRSEELKGLLVTDVLLRANAPDLVAD